MAVGYNPATPSDGLVFNVNTANPRSYSGGTVWRDLSRYGNNGTLTNGPTLNTGIGGGISFDGVDDFVNTTFNPANSLSGTYTITAWAKPTAETNYRGIAGGHIDGGTGIVFGQYENTSWNFGFGDGSTWGHGVNISLVLQEWVHIAMVAYTSIGVEAFKNGLSVGTDFDGATTKHFTEFWIGRAYNSGNRYFSGQINDIRVYNRALSGDEIAQMFNATRRRFGI